MCACKAVYSLGDISVTDLLLCWHSAVEQNLTGVYINVCCRPELPTHTSKCFEVIEEEPEVDVESGEEMITSEEDQSVLETELHTSPSEKLTEMEVRWFLIVTVDDCIQSMATVCIKYIPCCLDLCDCSIFSPMLCWIAYLRS